MAEEETQERAVCKALAEGVAQALSAASLGAVEVSVTFHYNFNFASYDAELLWRQTPDRLRERVKICYRQERIWEAAESMGSWTQMVALIASELAYKAGLFGASNHQRNQLARGLVGSFDRLGSAAVDGSTTLLALGQKIAQAEEEAAIASIRESMERRGH